MDLIAKIIGLYPPFRNVLRDDQNTALTNNWIVRRVQILIMDRGKYIFLRYSTFYSKVLALVLVSILSIENLGRSFGFILLSFPYFAIAYNSFRFADSLSIASRK